MEHLEVPGEPGQGLPHRLVDGLRAAGAAHDHQHRAMVVKAEVPPALLPVALQDLGADGGAGVHALALGILHGLREGAALDLRKGQAQLVGQARGHVRFMGDHRHAVQLRAVDHRHRHEAALGEHHVGLQPSDDARGLAHALDHAEGVGKVLPVEVPAQLAHGHRVKGDAGHAGYQRFLGAGLRADVVNLPSVGQQPGDQRQVRRDVARGAAARENDLLQRTFPP